MRWLPLLLALPLLAGCDLCWVRGDAMGTCPDDDDASVDDDDTGDDDATDPDDDDATAPDDDDATAPDDDDATAGPPCTPGQTVSEAVADAAGYETICVEPGSFQMGSPPEEPGRDSDELQHTVTLTRWFAAGRTEVTQELWGAVMPDDPSDCKYGCGDTLPVHDVTWVAAIAFCNELSAQAGLDPAYTIWNDEAQLDLDATGYRLPTEAEWEYVARAGEDHRYSGGDDVDEVGFCEGTPIFDDTLRPVGMRLPNAWGFVDMSGNAFEWVYDNYDDEYYAEGQVDPTGPIVSSTRVHRGGSYYMVPNACRVASRSYDYPVSTREARGLRIVRTLPTN